MINKKIFITWWSGNNVGDDLLAINFVQNTKFKKITFLYGKLDDDTINSIKQIKSHLSFFNNLRVVFKKRSSVSKKTWQKNVIFIRIGGSIWSEHSLNGWYNFLKSLGNNKTIYFGNNLSISSKNDYYKRLNELFDNSIFTSLRDSFSLENTNLSKIYSDPIYSLKGRKFFKERETIPGKVSITVAIPGKIFNFNFSKETLFNQIIEILTQRQGISKISLLSFRDKNDLPICMELKDIIDNKLNHIEVDIVPYSNLLDTLNNIKESEFMINTRFHSIILSNLFKKESYNLIYDTKNKYHLMDINAPSDHNVSYKIDDIMLKKIVNDSNSQFIEMDNKIKTLD